MNTLADSDVEIPAVPRLLASGRRRLASLCFYLIGVDQPRAREVFVSALLKVAEEHRVYGNPEVGGKVPNDPLGTVVQFRRYHDQLVAVIQGLRQLLHAESL